MTKELIIATCLLTILFSCQINKNVIVNHTNLHDKSSIDNFKWTELTDTTKTIVYYLQLNFLTFPNDDFIGKSIIDFKDSIQTKSFKLNLRQRQELMKLINSPTNFSEGDCGTFHLNAGFFVVSKDNIIATIDIGCGYNQWYFNPNNPKSKFGSFNDKGFKKMEKLLDDINITHRK